MMPWLVIPLALQRVDGAASCPTPSEVAAVLASIGVADSADVATLLPVEGGVEVVLADERGERKKSRRLLAEGSCAEMAQAAAVVIATWESELKAERLKPVALAVPRAPRTRAIAFDVAGGATASFNPDVAFGGVLAASLTPRRGRFGGRIAFSGAQTRDEALGTGHASYARYQLAFGPLYRLRPSRLLIDLHADVTVALLTIEGVGYQNSRRDLDVDPGLGAGARLGVRFGRVAPFVGLDVLGWLRRQRFTIEGASDVAVLPRWELNLSLGLAVGAFL
jgi:hypothetical protein